MEQGEKNNPATGASGEEIIKRQIEILEALNDKLFANFDFAPWDTANAIRDNCATISQLLKFLDPSFL